jgi:hypothetical protein
VIEHRGDKRRTEESSGTKHGPLRRMKMMTQKPKKERKKREMISKRTRR